MIQWTDSQLYYHRNAKLLSFSMKFCLEFLYLGPYSSLSLFWHISGFWNICVCAKTFRDEPPQPPHINLSKFPIPGSLTRWAPQASVYDLFSGNTKLLLGRHVHHPTSQWVLANLLWCWKEAGLHATAAGMLRHLWRLSAPTTALQQRAEHSGNPTAIPTKCPSSWEREALLSLLLLIKIGIYISMPSNLLPHVFGQVVLSIQANPFFSLNLSFFKVRGVSCKEFYIHSLR